MTVKSDIRDAVEAAKKEPISNAFKFYELESNEIKRVIHERGARDFEVVYILWHYWSHRSDLSEYPKVAKMHPNPDEYEAEVKKQTTPMMGYMSAFPSEWETPYG